MSQQNNKNNAGQKEKEERAISKAHSILYKAVNAPEFLLKEIRTGEESLMMTPEGWWLRNFADDPTPAEQKKMDKVVKDAILYLSEHAPSYFMYDKEYLEYFNKQPYAGQVWVNVAKGEYARNLFDHLDKLKGKDYEEKVWSAFAENINEVRWLSPENYMGKPYEGKIMVAQAKIEPWIVLYHPENFIGKPYEKELLVAIAGSNSTYDLLSKKELFVGKPFEKDVVVALARAGQINMEYYKDLYLGKPFEAEVALATAEKNPGAALSNPYFMNKPYTKQIQAIAQKSLAREDQALRTVQLFNQLHDAPDAIRFSALKYFDAADDFNLITQGRQEAYSSTYQHILDDMLAKLKASGKKLTEVLSPKQMERMDVFLEAAAVGNRMDDVVQLISPAKAVQVVHQLVEKSAKSKDMRYMDTMLSILTAPGCTQEIRTQLEREIKAHYDKAHAAHDQQTEDRFGLLAATYMDNLPKGVNFPGGPTPQGAFYLGIAQNSRYQLPEVKGMKRAQLVDKQGACNQRMIFANDDDAKSSFAHWKAQYQNKPGWKIEEHDNYTHISSTSGKVPVHIYANHPGEEQAGMKAIDREVAERQGEKKPSYQMLIGRGHIYHTTGQIAYLGQEKLVFLGSCGGYGLVQSVLAKSPHAQIIGTKVVGTMNVNDPLLFSINKSINQSGEIRWSEQEKVLKGLASADREDYVLPDNNTTLKLQQRFEQLKKDTKPNLLPGIQAVSEQSHIRTAAPTRSGGRE